MTIHRKGACLHLSTMQYKRSLEDATAAMELARVPAASDSGGWRDCPGPRWDE